MHSLVDSCFLLLIFSWHFLIVVESFSVSGPQSTNSIISSSCQRQTSYLFSSRNNNNGGGERSKRQERVGHLVQTELARILHSGIIKGKDVGYLEDELRQRISVVNTDVSPDLRQARVSISIRKGKDPENAIVEQRRAYSWLVSNTKALRHSLAQRMSHMKTCPNLVFVQVNVGAAVDVMYLIDKVAKGYKRETPIDLQEEEEEDDWIEDVF